MFLLKKRESVKAVNFKAYPHYIPPEAIIQIKNYSTLGLHLKSDVWA